MDEILSAGRKDPLGIRAAVTRDRFNDRVASGEKLVFDELVALGARIVHQHWHQTLDPQ
tara:strand:- start:5631 stop:5807 length:177 start_codon:yes stop_codon:yes gene_type:complete